MSHTFHTPRDVQRSRPGGQVEVQEECQEKAEAEREWKAIEVVEHRLMVKLDEHCKDPQRPESALRGAGGSVCLNLKIKDPESKIV